MVRIHQDSHFVITFQRNMAKEPEKKKAKERRPQALKRDMQGEKRRMRNRIFKSQVRTAIRHLDDAIAKKDEKGAKERLDAAYSLMDKGVKRGVFKVNKASRTKSRLAARLAKASA